MAQAKQPGGRAGRAGLFLLLGVVGIVGGVALLAYGLAPARDLWEAAAPAFSGGTPPEDLSERLDAAMTELKGRALVDAFGVLALMAGIVLVKQGLAKPKGKPVEQLVQEEVERRFAAQAPVAHGVQSALPLAAAAAARPSTSSGQLFAPSAVSPGQDGGIASLPSGRRTHCATCGSVLVAGGRICPQGHAQA